MTGICDLPSTHLAFEQRFSTEVACIEYLRRQRWPNGFHCPRCAGRRAWALRSRALDQCASCGHQVSLTAVTVFHGTRKPLMLWFRVIGQFLVSKSGCSAVDVSRQHGLKYETAWTWLHKLRSCMSQFGREPLDGSGEVDETYLGGEDDDAHKGRCLTGHKTPVAAAVEYGDEVIGRIRIAAVLNATALSLCGFVRQASLPARGSRPTACRLIASSGSSDSATSAPCWATIRRTPSSRCPTCTASSLSCAAGCSAPIREPATRSTCSRTSTSSCSASIDATPRIVGCSSSACSSARSRSHPPTRRSPIDRRYPLWLPE